MLLYNQLFKILQVSTDERLQLLTEPPKTPSVDNVWKWADAFVNKDYLSDILAYIEYPQKLQPSPVNFSSLVISQWQRWVVMHKLVHFFFTGLDLRSAQTAQPNRGSYRFWKFNSFSTVLVRTVFHSVLWHCWFGNRKGMRPEKKVGVGLLVVTIWPEICAIYSYSCHHHFSHP